MKKFLSLFLFSTLAFAQGDPAPYIKGQAASGLGNQASTVFVPNQQSTKINAYQARIETGNGNLLSNPSFEAGTYNSGWTCSLGSTTLETTAKTDGNKANAINSIGAGVRCYQTSTTNAANLKGLLGSAIVKIKTTDSIYKVCGLVDGNAAANERNCITVNPTSADLPFYPARTDFYMGGTSNGIVVYTTTTTSQPTVIDDAFVGVFNGGISTFSNNTNSTDYTLVVGATTTAPTQGAGAVKSAKWRREGPDMVITFNYAQTAAGSAGSGTYLFPLPSGYTISSNVTVTTSSNGAGGTILQGSGRIATTTSGATTASIPLSIFAFNSTNIFLVDQTANPQQGSPIGSTEYGMNSNPYYITYTVRIPIAGWEANTNAAIAGCVDAKSCTEEFSGRSTSAGVVSNLNVPGWVGNCVVSPTGTYTCPITGFTAPMNCVPGLDVGAQNNIVPFYSTSLSTSSQIVFVLKNTSGAQVADPFTFVCQRGAGDFKPKTVVVSPLQGYVKVPGAESLNVESFKVSYGAAATTICSVNGACAYKDELGTSGTLAVTNITRTSTGGYTLNTAKTYSRLKCTATVSNPGVFLQARGGSCTSCSSLSFISGYDVTAYDSYGTLDCTGVY